MAGRPGKAFSADVTRGTVRDGFAAFRREWGARVGEGWPLPGYGIGESGDLQVKVQAVKAHDVVIADVRNYAASFTGRTTGDRDGGDRVVMPLIRHGAWHFSQPNDRGETVVVPTGSFVAFHNGTPALCEVDPGAAAKVLILPAPVMAPLMGDRQIIGSTDSASSAEVRVLMAHASTVGETVSDLAPAGVQSARDALLELVRGVLRREFDDTEPRLAPALARAAMAIADDHLADPELTPLSLARGLNVSVRTLHRAFAAAGEPVAAYIRRRRLERARADLALPMRRPDVLEIAARWHFADSSHFIRAFKKQYGETPAQFAHSNRANVATANAGPEAANGRK